MTRQEQTQLENLSAQVAKQSELITEMLRRSIERDGKVDQLTKDHARLKEAIDEIKPDITMIRQVVTSVGLGKRVLMWLAGTAMVAYGYWSWIADHVQIGFKK